VRITGHARRVELLNFGIAVALILASLWLIVRLLGVR
jgi:hypothetical protein